MDTNLSEAAGTQKRTQILAGAAQVFAAEGYEGASMSQIAKAAAVSKGTVYNHFLDKASLFAAWVSDTLTRELAHIFEGADRDRDPAEALREMGLRMARMMLSPTATAIERVVVSEARDFPNLARAFYNAGPGPGIARMSAFLSRATDRGELNVPDPPFAAEQFFQLCQVGLAMPHKLQVIGEPTQDMIDRTVECAVRMFLNTYRPRSAPPSSG